MHVFRHKNLNAFNEVYLQFHGSVRGRYLDKRIPNLKKSNRLNENHLAEKRKSCTGKKEKKNFV